MDAHAPGRTALAETDTTDTDTTQGTGEDRLDFFVRRDGVEFAGLHLIVDLVGAEGLDDAGHIEAALVRAARAAGATVLNTDFHVFSPNDGVSGVVVLAESHISIHTWPERDFAAVDIFMCGDCEPMKALPVLKAAFRPAHVNLQEIRRGLTV